MGMVGAWLDRAGCADSTLDTNLGVNHVQILHGDGGAWLDSAGCTDIKSFVSFWV